MPDDMVSGASVPSARRRACLACNEVVDCRGSHTFPLRLGE